MRVVVRRAVLKDASAVHAVREQAIRESSAGLYNADAVDTWASGGSEDELKRRITATAGFVAVVDGQVVGWASLQGAEVDQLYVHPSHGGTGLARRLYEPIEVLARSVREPQLTAVASLRSIPVFRTFGFTEVRRADRRYDGHTFRVADMVKRLELKPDH